tara:strand:+ start:432 stop:869 length:438 start_codon:yes stop_codon:yes gene_type:complete
MPRTTVSAVTSVSAVAIARTTTALDLVPERAARADLVMRVGTREESATERRAERVDDDDATAARRTVAVVDPRAATAGSARAPTAKETDILARCVGSSPEAVDSASRVGDDVDLFRAMNQREISVLTVYGKQSTFFVKLTPRNAL